MNAVIGLFRAATQRAARAPAPPEQSAPPHYQGYVDERSTHHVAGWLRNTNDPAERCAYEVFLPGPDGERVLARGRGDVFSDILVRVGVGDGRYAFRETFDPPLSESERDRVSVRPVGAGFTLELAPALKIAPPASFAAPAPESVTPGGASGAPRVARTPGPFMGYIDERSVFHVAGWVRDMGAPDDRVAFEIVLPGEAGDAGRVLHRGRADTFSNVLRTVGVGDGLHSFYVLLPETLTEAERERVFVRPVGGDHRLELAPGLKSKFEPISHVALDIVNNCNIRCPFCVYDYAHVKKTMFMSDETFEAAMRLIPYVTDGNFWLSCLHEATMHPKLVEFIEKVPAAHRGKLFYTTNLAKRMPRSYFDFLAGSGMDHLNISVESLDPEIYEKMRKGARHRIFTENWDALIDAFRAGSAAPKLRYNMMAYRSNLRDIPAMVEVLLRDKLAAQVEIRHTYDEPHIPASFRDSEFLTTAEWAWLDEALKERDPELVRLILPPGGVGYDAAAVAMNAAPVSAEAGAPAPVQPVMADAAEREQALLSRSSGKYDRIPRPLNIGMDWDGTMRIYGEEPRGPGEPPTHVNYVQTNIAFLRDPLRFLLAL